MLSDCLLRQMVYVASEFFTQKCVASTTSAVVKKNFLVSRLDHLHANGKRKHVISERSTDRTIRERSSLMPAIESILVVPSTSELTMLGTGTPAKRAMVAIEAK